MKNFLKKHPNVPLLFFLSGISGLVYETVWFRMLIRVFGTTLEATSTVLAVFMGGLALGAVLAGKKADKLANPLKVYAVLEVLVALTALAATLLMAGLPELIAPLLAEGGAAVTAVRLLVSAAVLLVPTVLMGATLPLLASYLSSGTSDSGEKISRLYALNTLGAVLGVLISGYLLLGHLGEKGTAIAAAALNILIALRLAAFKPEPRQPGQAAPAQTLAEGRGYRRMLLIMGVTGFTALALEVLWARALVLTIGNSVYAFSAMLGVYLLGIALGSLYAEKRAGAPENPLPALARTQAGIAILAAAGLAVFYFIGRTTLHVKYIYSPLTQASDIFSLFGWTLLIVFPVTLLMGFFFPVAAQVGVRAAGRVGAIGPLYGANTLGTIAGSLAAGFILIPQLGTKFSFIIVALLAALTGAVLAGMAGEEEKRRFTPWLTASTCLALAAFALPDPVFNIIHRRLAVNIPGQVAYYNEDRAGAVSVIFSRGGDIKTLFINGFSVSGNGQAGKLMSHFPLIFQADPKEMFIIGLGAGNTMRSGVTHGVGVTVAELVSSVRETGPLFVKDWKELLDAGKFTVRLNDGRNELLRSRKLYDAIIVDVTPPIYSSGSVNVYSRDFFVLARKKLSKTGVFSIWIPKPCFESDYFMMLRSLREVFPCVNVWSFPGLPGFLALASNNELDMDPAKLEARIKRGNVRKELPFVSARFIKELRFMTDEQVVAGAMPYPAVTDDMPYTEFPLARFMAFSPVWY
ncbi:MAG: hypothetical protein A2X35_08545 [Elusimicrobia bacterium GWA2_61_42]|nr:MAG: hypothetical protein A2X35_08545 [Elusimicrobia bacterium GWA2_61_42]OGR77284.1 MAG: hypothetical protein A2X38_09095 [Elusimicrobia bacterium GWC2_61_25]